MTYDTLEQNKLTRMKWALADYYGMDDLRVSLFCSRVS